MEEKIKGFRNRLITNIGLLAVKRKVTSFKITKTAGDSLCEENFTSLLDKIRDTNFILTDKNLVEIAEALGADVEELFSKNLRFEVGVRHSSESWCS